MHGVNDRSAREALLDLMVLFPTVFLLIIGASQLSGLGIARWHLPAAMVLTMAAIFTLNRDNPKRATVRVCLIFLAIVTLSVLLAVLFIDDWYDSRTYHGPAALALAGGWSPYLDWSVCAHREEFCFSSQVYLDHYAKAAWYLSAGLYAFTGALDVLKGFNLYLLCLAFIAAYHVIASISALDRKTAGLLAICIAANPVALAQVTSNYIDGLFASYLTIYLLQLLDFAHRADRRALYRALIILPVILNIKLTAVAYVPVLTAAFLVLYIWRHHERWLRPALALGTVGALSIVAVGFNPYVTNLLTRGEPFWPAYSFKSEVSAISRQADPEFMAKNRFSKLAISIFSVEDDGPGRRPAFVLPFTRISPESGVDKRFNGFGPLFSGILLLALLQQGLLWRQWFWTAAVLSIAASVFITSGGWWARLAPQLWLAVALLQLGAFQAQQGNVVAHLTRVVTILNGSERDRRSFSDDHQSRQRLVRDSP